MADEVHGMHLGDEMVALALGEVDGPERTAMTAHLSTCPACRRQYDEIAAAVGDVLTVAPEVQPPVAFESRVLDRMAPAEPGGWRNRRRVWFAAAAAAVATVVTLAATLGGSSGSSPVQVAVLARGDGTEVGTVAVGEIGGRDVMVVTVLGAPPGVPYTCRTTGASGRVTDWGPFSAPDGDGAWVVELDDGSAGRVTRVDLVPGGSDEPWSTARFRA